MNNPSELKYSKSHEWVQMTGETTARIGLTDHAQDALGAIVFVNLPAVGDEVAVGESLGDVESIKSVSDIYSPVSATVSAVNEALEDEPEAINADPYGAWLVEVENITGTEELLDAVAYEAHCASEG